MLSEDPEGTELLEASIRLLGRLLGDVIRDQAGAPVYELVERVRRASVARHRERHEGIDGLSALLVGLPADNSLHVVRAFTLFSVLANIAEDVRGNWSAASHERDGAPPRTGTLRRAVGRVFAADPQLARSGPVLQRLNVVPVLTAHPTEVRNDKSLFFSPNG
jgi:phosphoenolpyruvate carboxylase